MMKNVLLLSVVLLLTGCTQQTPAQPTPALEVDNKTPIAVEEQVIERENPIDITTGEVCYGTACREVEIADSRQERMIGLMMREEMDDDT
jgi:type IV pilus biogenesis protein CpaD/CtpE